jgi:hypothetical protein
VERIVFALVAQRALEPGSKLACTKWVAERVAMEGCPGFDADAAYAAMDFLLDALGEIAAGVFATTATLLNLACDVVFVDTTSTYWELDGADEPAELADDVDDDGVARPVEAATRTFGHSKDFRTDLPQVVIGMAVTADGVPIRCWTFPGNTADTAIIRRVKDDLTDWNLHRLVWVADRGFASAANRGYLTAAAGTTSTPRSCARRTARPRPRWPAPAATARWPATCGSRRCGLLPAVVLAPTPTGCAPSGSWSAPTPSRPTATGWCVSG